MLRGRQAIERQGKGGVELHGTLEIGQGVARSSPAELLLACKVCLEGWQRSRRRLTQAGIRRGGAGGGAFADECDTELVDEGGNAVGGTFGLNSPDLTPAGWVQLEGQTDATPADEAPGPRGTGPKLPRDCQERGFVCLIAWLDGAVPATENGARVDRAPRRRAVQVGREQ